MDNGNLVVHGDATSAIAPTLLRTILWHLTLHLFYHVSTAPIAIKIQFKSTNNGELDENIFTHPLDITTSPTTTSTASFSPAFTSWWKDAMWFPKLISPPPTTGRRPLWILISTMMIYVIQMPALFKSNVFDDNDYDDDVPFIWLPQPMMMLFLLSCCGPHPVF